MESFRCCAGARGVDGHLGTANAHRGAADKSRVHLVRLDLLAARAWLRIQIRDWNLVGTITFRHIEYTMWKQLGPKSLAVFTFFWLVLTTAPSRDFLWFWFDTSSYFVALVVFMFFLFVVVFSFSISFFLICFLACMLTSLLELFLSRSFCRSTFEFAAYKVPTTAHACPHVWNAMVAIGSTRCTLQIKSEMDIALGPIITIHLLGLVAFGSYPRALFNSPTRSRRSQFWAIMLCHLVMASSKIDTDLRSLCLEGTESDSCVAECSGIAFPLPILSRELTESGETSQLTDSRKVLYLGI